MKNIMYIFYAKKTHLTCAICHPMSLVSKCPGHFYTVLKNEIMYDNKK